MSPKSPVLRAMTIALAVTACAPGGGGPSSSGDGGGANGGTDAGSSTSADAGAGGRTDGGSTDSFVAPAGGGCAARFSAASGTNYATPAPSAPEGSGSCTPGYGLDFTCTFTASNGVYTADWYALKLRDMPAQGTVDALPADATLEYNDASQLNTAGTRSWAATAGTVTVTSFVPDTGDGQGHIDLRVDGATMASDPVAGGGATGTVTLDLVCEFRGLGV